MTNKELLEKMRDIGNSSNPSDPDVERGWVEGAKEAMRDINKL